MFSDFGDSYRIWCWLMLIDADWCWNKAQPFVEASFSVLVFRRVTRPYWPSPIVVHIGSAMSSWRVFWATRPDSRLEAAGWRRDQAIALPNVGGRRFGVNSQNISNPFLWRRFEKSVQKVGSLTVACLSLTQPVGSPRSIPSLSLPARYILS